MVLNSGPSPAPTILLDSAAWVLGIAFITSAGGKALDSSSALALVRTLGLSDRDAGIGVAIAIIGEFALGACLLAGRRWAPLTATIGLIAGATVLRAARHRGYQGACGCFGILDRPSSAARRAYPLSIMLALSAILSWEAIYDRRLVHPVWKASRLVSMLGIGALILAIGCVCVVRLMHTPDSTSLEAPTGAG